MRRRQFVSRAAQTAAFVSTGALTAGGAAGANQRVHVGLIGCGGRGMLVAKAMRQVPGVEFVAVCDVYEPRAEAARQWAGPRCSRYADFRKLLDLKPLDAVLVATPDHWHAIPTVLACQAGKDVFVEKPLAHNVREGRAMVDAARRHGRIVQAGLQHRSAGHYRQAERIVRAGQLGRVHFVRIWNYANMFPAGIGKAADSQPPPGVDWDFYLGPAPYVPFNKNRFVNTYRWFWDYGGGMLTDYGTHRFDSLHQVMGVDAPRSVTASGGRYALDDGGQTPDVVQVTYEYPGFILSYEACTLNAHGTGGRTPGRSYYQARAQHDRPHGEAFYGTNGTLLSDRLGFEVHPELKPAQEHAGKDPAASPGLRMAPLEASGRDATDLLAEDFIECVRSRKRPVADVEIAHRATIVGHLGNIAYRTGRKIRWDAAQEQIVGDPQAAELLGRKPRPPWDKIL